MTEEFPPNTNIGRNALAVLAALPLFEDLDPQTLLAVADHLELFCLPSGSTLFEQGDPADSLYAVISGTLGAFRRDGDSEPRLIGRVQPGETVGEGALISGGLRTATIKTLRDSDLVRFSKTAFDQLVTQYPSAMLHIARLTVTRLERSLRNEIPRMSSRSFAILGNRPGVDTVGFARTLTEALAGHGRTELFTRDLVDRHTSAWFNEVEAQRDFVVFVADNDASSWTRQCIAQADTLVLLANAHEDPRPWASLESNGGGAHFAQRAEMVLQHRRFVRPGAAKRWLGQFPDVQHHHVCAPSDVARVARILTGNAVGIVFSGGGARGFAHIGVVKALREARIPIDLCGGSSIGSVIASGVAAGWSDEQMLERYRRSFVDRNPIGDYTLPLISLASGRRVSRLLRREVGDIDVEDLRLPYFCVSANLANSKMVVHRTGPLWRALRASVAIPGILPPVFYDRQILVDGGVVNHLPVDVMRGLGRGRVIGVDVGSETALSSCEDVDELSLLSRFDLLRRKIAPNILQLLLSAGSLSTELVTEANRQQSSILLTPELQGIGMLDWNAFEKAIEAGYRSTLERMDEIHHSLVRERRKSSI
jgi:NTE family protein